MQWCHNHDSQHSVSGNNLSNYVLVVYRPSTLLGLMLQNVVDSYTLQCHAKLQSWAKFFTSQSVGVHRPPAPLNDSSELITCPGWRPPRDQPVWSHQADAQLPSPARHCTQDHGLNTSYRQRNMPTTHSIDSCLSSRSVSRLAMTCTIPKTSVPFPFPPIFHDNIALPFPSHHSHSHYKLDISHFHGIPLGISIPVHTSNLQHITVKIDDKRTKQLCTAAVTAHQLLAVITTLLTAGWVSSLQLCNVTLQYTR